MLEPDWKELQQKDYSGFLNIMQAFLLWPFVSWVIPCILKTAADRVIPPVLLVSLSGRRCEGLDQKGLKQEHTFLSQPLPNLVLQEVCNANPPGHGSGGSGASIIEL